MGAVAEILRGASERFEAEEPLTVSEWARRFFVIPGRVSIDREDTPYVPERLPYQREILDTYGDLGVTEIDLMGPAQGGKTLPMHICLAYTIDRDPGPAMYVMPDELTARQIMKDRIVPTLHGSRQLERHLTGYRDDETNIQVSLDSMDLLVAWSNSPSKLASRGIYRLWLDETDKYPGSTIREAGPHALAMERLKNYLFAKAMVCSTPTVRTGFIYSRYQLSDKRQYYVPCPHCGFHQTLKMGQVKKPADVKDWEEVLRRRLAWYECEKCHGHWDNEMKNAAVRKGVWCPENCLVDVDGRIVGERPHRSHVGFWWNCLAVTLPTVTLSHCMAKFMEAVHSGDLGDLQNFQNSWMADIYEQKVSEQRVEALESLTVDYAHGTVPQKHCYLVAGADVQLDVIRYVIRGFGAGSESWMIEAGKVETFDELANMTILRQIAGPDGFLFNVMLLCVDARYRTEEVYDFSARYVARAVPIMGKPDAKDTDPIYSRHVVESDRYRFLKKRHLQLERFDLNTGLLKDSIQRLQGDGSAGVKCMWHIPRDAPAEYAVHICGQEKVVTRHQRKLQTVWRDKPQSAGVDFWDCEVYALAAARIVKVLGLPTETVERAPSQEDVIKREIVRQQVDNSGAWDIGAERF